MPGPGIDEPNSNRQGCWILKYEFRIIERGPIDEVEGIISRLPSR